MWERDPTIKLRPGYNKEPLTVEAFLELGPALSVKCVPVCSLLLVHRLGPLALGVHCDQDRQLLVCGPFSSQDRSTELSLVLGVAHGLVEGELRAAHLAREVDPLCLGARVHDLSRLAGRSLSLAAKSLVCCCLLAILQGLELCLELEPGLGVQLLLERRESLWLLGLLGHLATRPLPQLGKARLPFHGSNHSARPKTQISGLGAERATDKSVATSTHETTSTI